MSDTIPPIESIPLADVKVSYRFDHFRLDRIVKYSDSYIDLHFTQVSTEFYTLNEPFLKSVLTKLDPFLRVSKVFVFVQTFTQYALINPDAANIVETDQAGIKAVSLPYLAQQNFTINF